MIKSQYIAFITVLHLELQRMLRVWMQALLPPAITTILYFVIFGHVIGSRVGMVHGRPFIEFIAPGLIIMSVITSSYSGAVAGFFGAKFLHSIEELLVSPMHSGVMLLGYVTAGMLRGLAVGVLVTIIALFFTGLHIHSIFTIILVALVTACIFSLGGILNALYAKKFDDISVIPTFVLTPLTYLGGVFYPIQMLPKFWQYVSYMNPIVYIVHSFRSGFFVQSELNSYFAFLVMILFALALYLLTYHLINRGVGLRQ